MKRFLLIIALIILGIGLYAQEPQFVSKEPQNRNVLIEMFTARDEAFSPDAHKLLNEIIDENFWNLWAVNIHSSVLSPTTYPNLNTSIGDQILSGFDIWGFPSGVVNRSTDKTVGRYEWWGIVDQQLNQKAEVNVAGQVNIDAITCTANIEVEVYYTGNSASTENYLTVIMLQDSIIGSQAGASFNPEQVIGDGQYCHMYVLRDVITDTLGDKIFPTTSGTLLTKKYTYEIPEVIGDPNGVSVDIDNISFIAFVTESHNGEVSKPILNANKLSVVSDVDEISAVVDNDGYSLKFTVTNKELAECKVVLNVAPVSPTIITIPSKVDIDGISYSVESIGHSAFRGSSNLVGVDIPESIASIGSLAFKNCSNLRYVNCSSIALPKVSEYVFGRCPADMRIFVPENLLDEYKNTSPWNNYEILSMSSGIHKIIVKNNINSAVNVEESYTGLVGYRDGETVALKAVPNDGYTFAYWTEDNNFVSKDAAYTFTAQSDRNLVANFIADDKYWTPDVNMYSHSMVVTADVQLDGVSKNNTAIELGAFCGDELRGSATLQYFEGVEKCLYQFLVYGNPDDAITFKLYDHNKNKEVDYMSYEEIVFSNNAVHGTLNEPKTINFVPKHKVDVLSNGQGGEVYGTGYYNNNEVVTISANPYFGYAFVNWTSEGEVVSTDKSFTVTVTDDISYTANFAEAHSTILKNGWNWYSSYVDINGADGLNFMKKELSGVANILKGKSEFSNYMYDYNLWLGDLKTTSTEEMYMIHLEDYEYTFSVAGLPVNPEEYPIELNPNWNWMAYPVSFNMSVNEAFVNHKPSHGDILKSQTKVCQYYEGVGWMGELEIMEPGKGYMYQSNAQESITFTYPNMGSTRGARNERNAEKYWDVDETKYSTNMNVIAIVMQDGKEVSDCEIAAFYEDECRGSARPMYIEQLDRYLTFLTIHGEGGETLKFKYYDIHTGEVSDLLNEMTYEVDGINGEVANPYIFGNNISDINAIGEVMANGVDFYPNPVNDKLYIETEVEIEEVSIFDIYGRIQNLSNSATQQLNNSIDVSGLTSGVYFVKVVTSEGEAMKRIVKK